MNDKINNLKDKIQGLISQAVEKNNKQKECLNFLFDKLEEVKELETLEKLKEYENGKCLRAYLFYQSIKRANYQIEHLKLTKLDNIDKCLEMIEKDLEANEPQEKKLEYQPTNEQLLTLLGERIEKGEIKYKGDGIFPCLCLEDEKGNETLTIDLETGKIEPDPAEEFFNKHK